VNSHLRLIIFLTLMSIQTAVVAADFVVIANPASGVDKLSKDEVVNIYMGRSKRLPSGISALPIDVVNPLSEKSKFYSAMVAKELPEVNAYWARLMFSGQASPPRIAENSDEALEIVGSNKGAIAYIDRKKVDKRVKVVFDPGP
jgi:ABC-type phosphate transport system substrate-binding protein